MMQVRCQRCGWMLTLGREAIAMALAQAQQSHEQHHVIDCPHCRRAIKVSVAELRRRLPANYPLPEIAPPAAENQSKEPPKAAAPGENEPTSST